MRIILAILLATWASPAKATDRLQNFQQALDNFQAQLSADFRTQNMSAIPADQKAVEGLKKELESLYQTDEQTYHHWQDILSQEKRFESLPVMLISGNERDITACVASLVAELTPQSSADSLIQQYLKLGKLLRQAQANGFKNDGSGLNSGISGQLAATDPSRVGQWMDGSRGLASANLVPVSASVQSGRALRPAAMQLAAAQPAASKEEDPYLWLEDQNSSRAIDWAKQQNQKTMEALTTDPRFKKFQDELRPIPLQENLLLPVIYGPWAYNFWQDKDHQRGIWRRTTLEDFESSQQHWETILDFDKLDKDENENWVWKGSNCLPPQFDRCLLFMSRGGGAVSVQGREFDISSRSFVKNGFSFPSLNSDADWVDIDHLILGTDFGPNSLTQAGYPRIAKIWERGTPLSEAQTVYEGLPTDVEADVKTYYGPNGSVQVISRQISDYVGEEFVVRPDGKYQKIPFPDTADFKIVYHGQALALLRKPWKTAKGTFPAGALVSMPLDQIGKPHPEQSVQIVYKSDNHSALSRVAYTKNALYLQVLHNVNGEIWKATLTAGGWEKSTVPLPKGGNISFAEANPIPGSTVVTQYATGDRLVAQYASFLKPPTLYDIDGSHLKTAPVPFYHTPERFKTAGLVTEQHWASSKDGTKVPYFIVHPKKMKLDGKNPTIVVGYGGFEISQLPRYNAAAGKSWMEEGHVYVVANIRGGGEFGPRWHEGVTKENHHLIDEDYTAVARDLISKKITSPKHLGAVGASQGGLLTGIAATQHPELYNAVLSQLPLLDMMRYTKIRVGSPGKEKAIGESWKDEYGDPDDPKMAEVIRAYSPYQNLKAGVTYPKMLLLTATTDDVVGPAHARKMAARMDEMNIPHLFYENTEGGHGAGSTPEEFIKTSALIYTYLNEQLADGKN